MGIPLCEGSCALAGSVALVMILYGASQWLNYDLFGLFVAARQVGDFGGWWVVVVVFSDGFQGRISHRIHMYGMFIY